MTIFSSKTAPRHFPSNPVLVAFRDDNRPRGVAIHDWMSVLDRPYRYRGMEFTAEQIEHARRVLTRLAIR